MGDLILFWMQWSWKWTQWKVLAKKYWMKIFETGQELRKIISSWSDLWNKIKEIMNSWNLVDTKVIMEVVDDFLQNISSDEKVIFDWIPRNMEQFEQFEKVMKKSWRNPIAIYIKLEKKEAINRLVKRFNCVWIDMTNNPLMTENECIKLWWKVEKRSDDNEKAISNRLDVFFKETLPVIEKYSEKWKFFEIDWLKNVEEVSVEINWFID